MNATLQELSEFHHFVESRLAEGCEASLEELLDEWAAIRDQDHSVVRIQESVRQYETGQGMPLRDAFAEIRRELEQRK